MLVPDVAIVAVVVLEVRLEARQRPLMAVRSRRFLDDLPESIQAIQAVLRRLGRDFET